MPEKTEDKAWSGFLKVASALVAAVGGPILGGLGLKEWASTHKLLAVIVVLIYEAAVFFVYLIGKIWKRLEDRWIDALSQWVGYRVQALISRYRRKYLEHMVYECRDFDVKGLTTQGTYTLELQRVFVELSVDTSPSHRTTANPIPKLPARLEEGQHEIWEYLETGRNLALIGAPGSGKTTLLRHIALVLAVRRSQLRGKMATRRPTLLPVLLFLRYHVKALAEKPELTLSELIESSALVKSIGKSCPGGWFERQLQKGRCLVLLDGLDEVADPDVRRKLVNWLEGQMRTYAKNLFLVTSRPYGYLSNPLSSVNTLSVRSFSPSQVRTFVSNWYLSNEIISHNREDLGVLKEAEKGAEDLMRRIRSSTVLTELAVNPLLLTMIATVHRYRSELPGRRVELYREICEVFLGKRQDVREVERAINLTPSQKQCVLEPLAYHMMRERTREIDLATATQVVEPVLRRVSPTTMPADFFKMIENTSGLLLEKENAVYEFAHKTFQEYLAAIHCRNERLVQELSNYVHDEWWHETIRLYVAQADATPVFEMCLQGDSSPSAAIALAVECLEEAQQVDEKWRERLEQILTCETEDKQRQRAYGEALLSLRLRRMVAMDNDHWIDTGFVTQVEYQVFLDSMRAEGKYYQPSHWSTYRFARGEGARPIAGLERFDAEAFCRWLTERDSAWTYRLPNQEELDVELSLSAQNLNNAEVTGCWTQSGLMVFSSSQLEGRYYSKVRSFLIDKLLPHDSLRLKSLAHEIDISSVLPDVPIDLALEAYLRNPISWLDEVIPEHPFITADRLARDLHQTRNLGLAVARDLKKDMIVAEGEDFTQSLDRIMNLTASLSNSFFPERFKRDRKNFARRALGPTRTLVRKLASQVILVISLNPARTLTRDLAIDLARGLTLHLEDALNLEFALNFFFARDLSRSIGDESTRAIHLLTARSRGYLFHNYKENAISLGLKQRIFRWFHDFRAGTFVIPQKSEIKGLATQTLVRYVHLGIIEGRRQGKIPIVGGIRIVRERRGAKKEYKTPKIEVVAASAAFQ